MVAASRFSPCPSGAQLPPQEVNSWGRKTEAAAAWFLGPSPKTQRFWDSGDDLR